MCQPLTVNHRKLLISDILLSTRADMDESDIREVVIQTLKETNRKIFPSVVESLVKAIGQRIGK